MTARGRCERWASPIGSSLSAATGGTDVARERWEHARDQGRPCTEREGHEDRDEGDRGGHRGQVQAGTGQHGQQHHCTGDPEHHAHHSREQTDDKCLCKHRCHQLRTRRSQTPEQPELARALCNDYGEGVDDEERGDEQNDRPEDDEDRGEQRECLEVG